MENLFANTQVHANTLRPTLISLLIVAVHLLAGQSGGTNSKKAAKYFDKAKESVSIREYEVAKDFFKKAIEIDAAFSDAYLQLGNIHNRFGEEEQAYSYFKKYLSLRNPANLKVLLRTSLIAFDRGHYSDSEAYLKRYLQQTGQITQEVHWLEASLRFVASQDLSQTMSIEPMPDVINQFKLQYLPAFTVDGHTIFYTKRDFTADDENIVVSHKTNDGWSQPQSISKSINTPTNEGACTISADGKTLIFTSCDRKDSKGSCDLYISHYVNGDWSKPENMGAPINTRYWESQPSLSADGNTLYFTSNRKGGVGKLDVWVSRQVEGLWSVPQNLGGNINTPMDDATPFIHQNGEDLYFSSKGHPGMGGFDIFKSQVSRDTTPQNLGYPINTHRDEVALTISGDGKKAFFSKELHKGTEILESKIVSLTLPDSIKARPAYYLFGKVVSQTTEEPLEANVQVLGVNATQKSVFEGKSDTDGVFFIVLPAEDTLAIYVEKEGYLFHSLNFYASTNEPFSPDTTIVHLEEIKPNSRAILNNIYFDFDSYKLGKKSKVEINKLVAFFKQNTDLTVEISGHTDDAGSDAYNKKLSERRAEAVFNELVMQGLLREQFIIKGYGSEQPLKPNDSEVNRQSNRRIEFRVLRLGQRNVAD